MWTFVKAKIHDYWIWFAICKRTRQIISYHIGKRSNIDCLEFWRKIPKEYKQSITYSDYWESYKTILKNYRHQSVGKETGLTNHVERFNNSIRQRLGRLTRKTLSFSKSDEMLEINIRIFVHNYNLVKGNDYLNNVMSVV
jgi:insertion element IS1 protein InsB